MMTSTTARRRIVPPRESDSWEEARMVYHEDLADLSPAQLQYEAWWGGQLAARDPERFVWRGLEYVTVREWADERVRIIHNLLQPAPQPESTPAETKVRMGSWSTP